MADVLSQEPFFDLNAGVAAARSGEPRTYPASQNRRRQDGRDRDRGGDDAGSEGALGQELLLDPWAARPPAVNLNNDNT